MLYVADWSESSPVGFEEPNRHIVRGSLFQSQCLCSIQIYVLKSNPQ